MSTILTILKNKEAIEVANVARWVKVPAVEEDKNFDDLDKCKVLSL